MVGSGFVDWLALALQTVTSIQRLDLGIFPPFLHNKTRNQDIELLLKDGKKVKLFLKHRFRETAEPSLYTGLFEFRKNVFTYVVLWSLHFLFVLQLRIYKTMELF